MELFSLEQRLRALKDCLGKSKRIVVYIIEGENDSQCRYRCKNLKVAFSRENSPWVVIWFYKGEFKKIERYLDAIDLVVILRQTEKKYTLLSIIDKLRSKNMRVLFDLDDLLFDYKDLGLVFDTVREKSIFYWLGYIWGIRRIAKRVDGFTCTNEFLAGKLKRSFGKSVKVIPNSLNKEQIEVSEQAVKTKLVRKNVDDEFVIGYFSGSPTHAMDFALVEPELIRFLKEYENVKLVVVGYMKFSKQMRELVDVGRVEVMGVVDYLRLQELMSRVDVNIAPLVINDFTNCKSELKFFEAAAVETTTIASPNYSFKKAITDGKNGFLAKPGEWYQKLEYLYNHPEENRKIALEAKKYALKHYYGEEFLKEVEEAYDYFAK